MSRTSRTVLGKNCFWNRLKSASHFNFTHGIDPETLIYPRRRKAEDSAWAEASQFYNAHQKNVLSALDKGSRSRTPTSATAKGKQRAISQEPEDVEPWEHELPEQFRGSNGFDVARKLTERGVDVVGTGDKRGSTFRYKVRIYHLSAIAISAHTLYMSRPTGYIALCPLHTSSHE